MSDFSYNERFKAMNEEEKKYMQRGEVIKQCLKTRNPVNRIKLNIALVNMAKTNKTRKTAEWTIRNLEEQLKIVDHG